MLDAYSGYLVADIFEQIGISKATNGADGVELWELLQVEALAVLMCQAA